MKLYTDEEILEKCKDFQPIPLDIEQEVLHYKGDPDKLNILNGVKKSPYEIGQPVSNVNMYAHQLAFHIPIDPDVFLKQYNKVVDKNIEEQNQKIINELSRDIIDNVISGLDEIPEGPFEIPEAARAAPIVADIESQPKTKIIRKASSEGRTTEKSQKYMGRRRESQERLSALRELPDFEEFVSPAEAAQRARRERERDRDEKRAEEKKGEL